MADFRMSLAALAAMSAAAFGGASQAASLFTIQASNDMPSWQDVGAYFQSGTTYDFQVIDPATIWSAGSNDPISRESTADGIPADRGYGQYTFDGFTANYGALVGENNGAFFLIGTGAAISGLSGDVKVGYWDSFYGDNSGVQTLSIAAPEPAAWGLMMLGLGGLGLALRTRRRTAAALN